MSSSHPAASSGPPQPVAVLIVDGDLGYRQRMAMELGRLGHEVVAISDSDDWAHILQASRIDVVLIGDSQNESSHSEICQRIRKMPAHKETALLLLATHGDVASEVQGLEAGADDYLLKSVDLEVLKARLRVQLRRRGRLFASDSKDAGKVAAAGSPIDETPALEPEIDTEALTRLQENVDVAGVLELIDAILADAPKRLATMTTALEQRDAAALVMQAHQLKSSTALFGGMRLATECAELEALGRANRLPEATKAVHSLRTRFERFSVELREARRKWAGR